MTRPATTADLDRELAAQAASAQASLAAAQEETVAALAERDAERARVHELEQRIFALQDEVLHEHEQFRRVSQELTEMRHQIYWLERLHLSRLAAQPDGRVVRALRAGLQAARRRS